MRDRRTRPFSGPRLRANETRLSAILETGDVAAIDAEIEASEELRVAREWSARPGEVIVSATVKDLVAGSGLDFADRGVHQLRGIPGEWRLFAAR